MQTKKSVKISGIQKNFLGITWLSKFVKSWFFRQTDEKMQNYQRFQTTWAAESSEGSYDKRGSWELINS